MKNLFRIVGVLFLIFSIHACEKDDANAIKDIDGNVYKTITIGTQTWMAENLKTTKYKNGISIPNVTDNAIWEALITGAYCWYNNDATTYGAIYGVLYNWSTVNTDNLCPTGWHVPTDAEWTTLTTYLGGESVAGGKLKETGTTHWLSPNTGATNESGFTALPGGYRGVRYGEFVEVGIYGVWWSATEGDLTGAWQRGLHYSFANVNRAIGLGGYGKIYGCSVRCLRD